MPNSAAIDSPPQDAAALTHYIETRYHARHRQQLPDLAALSAKVERVHVAAQGVPAGLADLLQQMIGELEVHMKKEELVLFPAIRGGRGPDLAAPIAVMRADHDDHSAELDRIMGLTNGLTLPAGACRSWTALYDGLGEFVTDLRAHLALENDVLFAKFDTAAQGCGCGCGNAH